MTRLTDAELIKQKWYVVVDDCIGGFVISNVDKPTSQINPDEDEYELANFVTERLGAHIVNLHNVYIATQKTPYAWDGPPQETP